ncbi:MAG: glycosyltransferase family 2 protein [Bacteroidales bacterium]|nr:glycosyltransferase family 2 protein [Bacteroidales bacterium]
MTPKLICLTPVLNEAWILDRFLQCTSIWADHIIIADQGSTDGSVEIAKQYDKVIFIDNKKTGDFNEMQMRAPLFEAAKQIEGQKIYIGLDADEILTPNFDSPEWQTIYNAKPGTILSFPIHNLLPNGTYWTLGDIYCGFVDDGTPYTTGLVHSPRMILPDNHDVLLCHDISLLHYKYMDANRMRERNRWYQCFEHINKENTPIGIFRRYHHLEAIPMSQRYPWPEWWKEKYRPYKIEITSVVHHSEPRWDQQILDYFNQYGAVYFRHLNIWDVNWDDKAKQLGVKHIMSFRDPRQKWEKAVNRWLIYTQGKQRKTSVHLIEKLLNLIYK